MRQQMYYCDGSQHRFSEMADSDLFGDRGSFKEYVETAKPIEDGLSVEQIADILEKDIRTIEGIVVAIAAKSEEVH